MPRLAAMSRSLAPGSWAMHSSTRAWLVRKLQSATLHNIATTHFRKQVACFCAVRTGPGHSSDGDAVLVPGDVAGCALAGDDRGHALGDARRCAGVTQGAPGARAWLVRKPIPASAKV